MAYVLGFFMADGSLDINRRGSHYFSIQICDKKLLGNIRKTLNSNHKIGIRHGVGNENDRYRLQIGNKEMCGDLINLGVQQQKAYTMKLPAIPKKYTGDFIRGYFDGDGNVWTGLIHRDRKKTTTTIQTVFTSCSKSFLSDLREKLMEYGLGSGGFFFLKTAYKLQYSVNDSMLLYHLMYDNLGSTLFLERKKSRFVSFFKMKNKKMRS